MKGFFAFGLAAAVSWQGVAVADGQERFSNQSIAQLESVDDSARPGEGQASIRLDEGEDIPFYSGRDESALAIGPGGSVAHLSLYDSATVAMTGGEVSHFNAYDDSEVTISGLVDVSHFSFNDAATGKLSGAVNISHLTFSDMATGELSGGTFGFLNVTGETVVDIRKMTIEGGSLITPDLTVPGGALTLGENARVNLYASDVAFSDGQLSGKWMDGTTFAFAVVMRMFSEVDEGSFVLPTSMPEQIVVLAGEEP